MNGWKFSGICCSILACVIWFSTPPCEVLGATGDTGAFVSNEADFVMKGNTLEQYVGEGGHVVIPSEIDGNAVTKIAELAFLQAPIETLVVPGSVEEIEGWAFYDCNQMTHLTLEEGVEKIGEVAFYYCESLVEVNLPESLTSIGDEAFAYCLSLREITLPSALKKIEYGVFHACISLETIEIPPSVTTLGDWAFYNCPSLTQVTLPTSLTKIDDGTFGKCTSLTEITIPEGVRTLGDMVFLGCSALKQVFFPSTLRTMGDFIFSNTERIISLEEVEDAIPNYPVLIWGNNNTVVEEYSKEEGLLYLNLPSGRDLVEGVDVYSTDWFLAGMTYSMAFDILEGEDGYYSPNAPASRSATARSFAVASQDQLWQESRENDPPFSDVEEHDIPFVSWCLITGVMSGYGEGVFGSEDTLTREQFATVLASYGNYKNVYVTPSLTSLDGYLDLESISSYALEPMAWAVEHGLLMGYLEELNPQRPVTRGEVATVMLSFEKFLFLN